MASEAHETLLVEVLALSVDAGEVPQELSGALALVELRPSPNLVPEDSSRPVSLSVVLLTSPSAESHSMNRLVELQ